MQNKQISFLSLIKRFDKIQSKLIVNPLFNKIFFVLCIVLFGGLIFKLNIMTPLWSDDYLYSLLYNSSNPIKSISDLVESQYNHYLLWGGRTVGHTIVQLLLLTDPICADFINSLVYVFLIILVYIHSIGYFSFKYVYLLFFINMLLWFFIPSFGETILWITGSGNYLWCIVIILSFLLPYRLYLNSKQKRKHFFIKVLIMFCFGILAGWTNENVGISLIIMILFFIILIKNKTNSIPLWTVSGLIGCIIGFYLLISAPGNFERAGSLTNITAFGIYFKFNIFNARMIDKIGLIYLLSFILLVLVVKFKLDDRYKLQIKVAFIYFVGCLCSFFSMIPSPSFPDRAMFGGVIFSIIVLGIIFSNLNYKLLFIRFIIIGILSMFLYAFIFDLYRSYKDVKAINELWLVRDQELREAISNNYNDTIYIHRINASSTKFSLGDASFASESMSKYFKVDIQVLDD